MNSFTTILKLGIQNCGNFRDQHLEYSYQGVIPGTWYENLCLMLHASFKCFPPRVFKTIRVSWILDKKLKHIESKTTQAKSQDSSFYQAHDHRCMRFASS